MLIDTHCHLNFKAFKKDLHQVIKSATEAGISKIIIPGAKIDSSRKAVEIASLHEGCFATVGIHPHHADKADQKESLHHLARESKVVAIGEIGLDYYQYKGFPSVSDTVKKMQKELFLWQLELANEANLPVIIHCRNAFFDLLALITQTASRRSFAGVFHCFEGNKEQLNEVLNLGFYVGFDGNITYEENQNLRQLVKFTPSDRLLLETDSPFLTPLPFRGQRNEPKLITYTAQQVSEINQKSFEHIAQTTTLNAQKLFNI